MSEPIYRQVTVKQRKQYTHKQIRDYWAEKNIWKRKGYSSKDEFVADKYTCFACSFTFYHDKKRFGRSAVIPLERAHILPVGPPHFGPDEINNIHLLCHYCHTESENKIGVAYWKWFVRCNYIDRLMGVSVSQNPEILMTYHHYLSEGHSVEDIRNMMRKGFQFYMSIRDEGFRIGEDIFGIFGVTGIATDAFTPEKAP